MAQTGKAIFQNKNFSKAIFTTIEISPLKLLKQILAMFICLNDAEFTDDESELLNFIKNPNENKLPEKFRVFMYLNNVGKIRNLTNMYTNHFGLVNELTFPPLGFVLSVNSKHKFPLTEITHFKNIPLNYIGEVKYTLLNHPTHLPFPIDYRNLEEINEAVRKSELMEKNQNIKRPNR